MKATSKFVLSFFASSLILSCSAEQGINQINTIPDTKSESILLNTVIKGKAEFPENFKTKISLPELAPAATVSVIYPHDHSTKANQTIATGLTDEQGNFMINPSPYFKPVNGDIFVLEVIKRAGGPGNSLVSLRTFIRWNGTSWDSMTSPGIYINTKTTALALITHFNNLSASSTIGKIDTSGSTSVPNVETVMGPGTTQRIIYKDQSDYSIYMHLIGSEDPAVKLSTTTNNNFYPSVSANGEKIIYYGNDGSGSEKIYVTNADGSSSPVMISGSHYISTPGTSNDDNKNATALSDDGTKAVFKGDNSDIYTVITDGSSTPVKVNGTKSYPGGFNISPDGNKVVFYHSSHIHVVNSDGSGTSINLSAFTNGTDSSFKPLFTPDSTKIVFIGYYPDPRMIIVNTDGSGTPVVINDSTITTTSYYSYPKFSANSQKLSFVGYSNGHYRAYVVNTDGSGLVEILPAENDVFTGNKNNTPNAYLSDDGSKIAFIVFEPDSVPSGGYIHIRKADGTGTPQKINMPGIGSMLMPKLNTNGSIVSFFSFPNTLYIAKTDGSETPFKITNDIDYNSGYYAYAGSGPQEILSNAKVLEVAEVVTQVLNASYDPAKFIKLKNGTYLPSYPVN